MMNKHQRKNRLSSRQAKMKPPVEKVIPVEGVYGNSRFVHASSSLVGCVVQVHTKADVIYEGILRTFSNKLEIVLELAHIVKNKNSTDMVSKEHITEKMIFQSQDVVTLTAKDVDLEYATKDNFQTDEEISRGTLNGQGSQRELKELEPWNPDDDDDGLQAIENAGLHGDASNGWDPNEMFRINEDKYNVQSAYDSSLANYTTVLQKEDTPEFREREAKALRVAAEIEKSSTYQKRIEMENGDDEEEKFSAVARPDRHDRRTSPGGTGSGGNRYVPPHMRRRERSGGYMGQQGHYPRTTPPPREQQRQTPPSVAMDAPSPGSSRGVHPEDCEAKINGERMEKDVKEKGSAEAEKSKDIDKLSNETVVTTSIVTTVTTAATTTGPTTTTAGSGTVSTPSALASRPPIDHHAHTDPPRAVPGTNRNREQQLEELKRFSSEFKLADKHHKKVGESKPPTGEAEAAAEPLKRSTLNPNAKEFSFNPNAKPFTPSQKPPQTPTPPRPQTPGQSPVQMYPIMPGQPGLIAQYAIVTSGPMNQIITPGGQPNQGQRLRKDGGMFPAGAVVQPPSGQLVAAATGPPILAQNYSQQGPPQYTAVYMSTVPGQNPSGSGGMQHQAMAYPQVYSVVSGGRMVGPTVMVPTSVQSDSPNTNPQHVFVSTHQPGMPGNPNQPSPHPSAVHLNAQQMQGQNHQNIPGHPNPSPVHPGQTQTPPQSQPPTPQQSQIFYHQHGPGMPGHHQTQGMPQMHQPSPHGPTPQSPPAHAQYPNISYAQHMQHMAAVSQGSHGSMQQHTTYTYPQMIYMHPGQGGQGQMQPSPQEVSFQTIPSNQIPAHMQGPHVPGQYPMGVQHSVAGPMPSVSSAGSMPHQQMAYVPPGAQPPPQGMPGYPNNHGR